ncbi:MAG: hypothetical protein KDJ64_11285 [Nitratireductor sp.]|nr:hypothetical protein [Nitratireductor sp.]
MAKSKPSAGGGKGRSVAYKVVTVSELDRMVYDELVRENAARAESGEPGRYVITNKKLAHSGVVMPKVLNPLGKKGWVLEAVNKMECYIFSRAQPAVAVEYKVLTPADLDRSAVLKLEKSGALALHHFEGQTPAMEVVDASAAKIQNVLPALLEELADEGWRLSAVSGPQLYFFTRPV